MPDREKVFDAIRNCITEPKCRDCPWDECEKFDCLKVKVPVSLMLDALKLLKEQESLAVRMIDDFGAIKFGRCPTCNAIINNRGYPKSCGCGQAVKWE